MNHLRKFKSEKDYTDYLTSGDIWLPRVSHITDSNRVDFATFTDDFIQVCNGGVCYINDTDKSSAYIDDDGCLIINSDDVYIDNGQIVYNR